MKEMPKQVYHGTSRLFLRDMTKNGISAPSYWTNSLETARQYASSYTEGVVLVVNIDDYEFAANMQVAQCMHDNCDIDTLPDEADLAYSLEFLEGIVCNETIFKFELASGTESQQIEAETPRA